jgi:hypothetical protein
MGEALVRSSIVAAQALGRSAAVQPVASCVESSAVGNETGEAGRRLTTRPA